MVPKSPRVVPPAPSRPPAGRIGAAFGSLRADGRGSVAVIAALALLPMAAMVGAAVDYTMTARMQTALSRAADAAALAAVNSAKQQIAAGKSDTASFTTARSVGSSVYASLVGSMAASGATPTIDMTHSGRRITATLTANGSRTTLFGGLLTRNTMTVNVKSGAATELDPYVDVALLVDVSGSMAIGADAAAIATLRSALGCAFACHDGNPVMGTSMDAYEWAVSQGIPLRTQAVNSGIGQFLDWLGTRSGSSSINRVGIWSFSDSLSQVLGYTSNFTMAKSNLPQTTNAASEYTAATHFNEIMPAFTLQVGTGGDGSTTAKAKKLVIIATDGAQDPNRTWTWNLALRPQVAPFDPANCAALKAAGVSVAIIHTPYVPMTWDWGYNATLGQPSQIGGSGTRDDDIAPQLQKCASPGFYVMASSSTIAQAFQNIFIAFSPSRITQ